MKLLSLRNQISENTPHTAAESKAAGLLKQASKLQGESTPLLAMALLSAIPSVSHGDSQNKQSLEEVFVDGRSLSNPYADPAAPFKADKLADDKYTKPALDLPKTLTIITEEAIQAAGATTINDLMRTQPGITLGTGEGGNAFGDRFIIRGFDARNDIYIDGLRDPGVVSRESFAVQQVEIAKGPSSTFAGRGTTGGAVNLVSKAPSQKEATDIHLGLGNEEYKRVTLDTSQNIGEQLAMRVNALYHDANKPGRNNVSEKRSGLALAATWKPSAQLNTGLDLYYFKGEAVPDWGHPWDAQTQTVVDVPRETFYGYTNRDFWDTESKVASLSVDWEIGESTTWHNQLRWGTSENAYIVSAPRLSSPLDQNGDPIPGADRVVTASSPSREQKNEISALQSYFVSKIGKHSLVAGVELADENFDVGRFSISTDIEAMLANDATSVVWVNSRRGGLSQTAAQNLYQPMPTAWRGSYESVSPTLVEQKSNAAFLMDTIDINEQWIVSAGIRAESYDISRVVPVAGVYENSDALEQSQTLVDGHASLIYKPRPNGSIYFSLGTSSDPMGANPDAGGLDYGAIVSSNEDLKPEENTNLELGSKWELFDEHLLLTAAVFNLTKTGVPTRNPELGNDNEVNPYRSEGEREVRGFEINVNGNINDIWSVAGGVSVLDTEITKSLDAEQLGAKIPNVAENSFTLLNQFAVSEKLNLGGTFTYTGEIYGGTTEANDNNIDSWTRLDVFANYTLTNNLELSLNILNLTDETYYDALYRSGSPFVYVAPGRSITTTLSWEF
ncbi:catecholate siderophore receptor [Alteromonadaceae bacterium Bs31]|nr:catecholate siderophore receptor [Alteromonadaceae bacterium Bs31]